MTDAVDAAGVLPLYPQTGSERPLRGLYLDHGLRSAGQLIYANFISSLDGRVALPDGRGVFGVPAAIANPRDWWLFQELAVQADAMLVSGRYLRARARGEVQDLFAAFHDTRYEELRGWRKAQGLPAWPRVVVLTRTVDFEPPPDIDASRLLVLSGAAGASSAGARRLRSAGAEVVAAGAEDGIDAHRLRGILSEAGCHRVYAVGGPRVLHLLAAGAALDRLYLSLAPRLLGGEHLSTLVEGAVLDPAPVLKLYSLYYDQATQGAGAGQMFACYAVADESDVGG
ncbi:MAG: dihydrofolate reductase family protein [Acidihalobacter sp.]